MASRRPNSPDAAGDAESTEQREETSRDETEEGSPERSELYDTKLWGSYEEGKEKIKQYGDVKGLQDGAFSNVLSGRKDGKVYAIKVISKMSKQQGVKSRIQALYATREVRALRDLQGTSFINSVHEWFQTPTQAVIVLDYVPGGDLFEILTSRFLNNEPFSQDEVRFYLAEVLLGLEAIHKKDIVHRDIKLENVLVSEDGHIQLTDFGLCKYRHEEDMGGRRTPDAGTQEYTAPEVLVEEWRKDTCDFAQDWYSFGVLGMRLFNGKRRFPYSSGPVKLPDETGWMVPKECIISAMKSGNPPNIPLVTKFGDLISPQLQDLLFQLLKLDCSQRLGSRGVDEIKQHPFFKTINWDDAAKRELAVPQRE